MREEVSIRAASVVAIESVREEICCMTEEENSGDGESVSSTLIDFYLSRAPINYQTGNLPTHGRTRDDSDPHPTLSRPLPHVSQRPIILS